MKKIEYEVKPTYNLRRYVKYVCEVCGKKYADQGDAYCCEQRHKNKEALLKTEPKYKSGDVVTYMSTWSGHIRYAAIQAVRHSYDYDRWVYILSSDRYTTYEENQLIFVCSREEGKKLKDNLISNVKNKLGIPKKNIDVELNCDGSLTVKFNTTVDKIPVVKQED